MMTPGDGVAVASVPTASCATVRRGSRQDSAPVPDGGAGVPLPTLSLPVGFGSCLMSVREPANLPGTSVRMTGAGVGHRHAESTPSRHPREKARRCRKPRLRPPQTGLRTQTPWGGPAAGSLETTVPRSSVTHEAARCPRGKLHRTTRRGGHGGRWWRWPFPPCGSGQRGPPGVREGVSRLSVETLLWPNLQLEDVFFLFLLFLF